MTTYDEQMKSTAPANTITAPKQPPLETIYLNGTVEEQERKERKTEWEKLKSLRDSGQISKEEFKKSRTALFSNDIND